MQLHCAIVWTSTTEMTKKTEPKRWSCVQVWCARSDRSALPSHTTTSPGTRHRRFPKSKSSKSAPYPVETQGNSSRRLIVETSTSAKPLCEPKYVNKSRTKVWIEMHRLHDQYLVLLEQPQDQYYYSVGHLRWNQVVWNLQRRSGRSCAATMWNKSQHFESCKMRESETCQVKHTRNEVVCSHLQSALPL